MKFSYFTLGLSVNAKDLGNLLSQDRRCRALSGEKRAYKRQACDLQNLLPWEENFHLAVQEHALLKCHGVAYSHTNHDAQ